MERLYTGMWNKQDGTLKGHTGTWKGVHMGASMSSMISFNLLLLIEFTYETIGGDNVINTIQHVMS